jgi:hypothetical protein
MPFFDDGGEVRLTLDALQRLVGRIDREAPDGKLALYAQMRVLMLDLERYNERESDHPKGMVRQYLIELADACRTLAGLSETSHSEQSQAVFALTAIQKLRTDFAFGVHG